MGFLLLNKSRRNLFALTQWVQNSNYPFSVFKASIQGESLMKSPSAYAGAGIQVPDMKNGKIYMAEWEYENQADATAYPYATTASVNTAADGQSMVQSNNTPIGVRVKQGLSICYLPETYKWIKLGNGTQVGQSFKAIRPKLVEDKNWSDNIFNAPCENLIVNGDFISGNTYGWLVISSSLSIQSGALKIENTSSTPGSAYQYIKTTIGQIYTLKFNKPTGGSGILLRIGSTANTSSNILSTGSLASGSYSYTFTARSETTVIRFAVESLVSGNFSYVGNISVTGGTIHNLIRNHFRADCVQVTSATNQTVPTIYNTVGTQATQTTATKQPLHLRQLQPNGDNRDYLQFDGVDDAVVYSEDMSNSQFDIWILLRDIPSGYSPNSIFGKATGTGTSRNIAINLGISGQIIGLYIDETATSRLCQVANNPPATGINLIRYSFNPVTGSVIRLNNTIGTTNTTPNIPANTTNTCCLGALMNTSGYFQCKTHEILSFNRVLSGTEAQQVLKYLRGRYGTEANF
jgi:hypothetical protein